MRTRRETLCTVQLNSFLTPFASNSTLQTDDALGVRTHTILPMNLLRKPSAFGAVPAFQDLVARQGNAVPQISLNCEADTPAVLSEAP